MKPRRSILSVPGHIKKMHDKAMESKADVVMLDLEDSVPLEAKKEARKQVVRTLLSTKPRGRAVAFRINAIDSPFGYRDLLEVVESAGDRIDTVVVPKVNHPGDIHFVERLLAGIEMSEGLSRPIGIEASIESAEGLERVSEIARAGNRLVSLVFGIADYSASVGARLASISGHGEKEETITPGHRWHFPVSRMVMAAKSAGILAVDAPYGHFKDVKGLETSAQTTCALGCDGKWAIHPDQIDTINRVFSPADEDVERARRILEADETARKNGLGAVAVDGRMVDQATVRLARRLWDQAAHIKRG
jgi:citrate lyase beta subunit